MSLDQRKTITDVVRWILYASISLASFLAVDVYRGTQEQIRNIDQQMRQIDSRLIRIEYELKLK